MLPTDRPAFAEVMAGLGRIFERQLTDELLADFWDALRDLPLEAVKAAAQRHGRIGKYFPKPRDLRFNPDGERVAQNTSTPWAQDDPWTAMLNKTALMVLISSGGLSDAELDELADDIGIKAASLRSSYGANPDLADQKELREIRDNIGATWARRLGVRWTPKPQVA